MVEVGRSKGQRILPLPMGWQQGRAMGRDTPATPRSLVSDDMAELEASVVTWHHLLQGLLSATPQAAFKVCNDSTNGMSASPAHQALEASHLQSSTGTMLLKINEPRTTSCVYMDSGVHFQVKCQKAAKETSNSRGNCSC